MRHTNGASPATETNMQQTRKTSFLKTLLGAKRQVEPKKALQPIDERQLGRVAGGTGETDSPRGGWQ
jgi:hypothetical protein